MIIIGSLPADCEIDIHIIVYVEWIGENVIQTLGSAEITIFGHQTNFQLISEEFPIPCEGLLGVEYIENSHALLDFEHKLIRVGEKQSIFKVRKPVEYKDRCISEAEAFSTESETNNVSNGSNQINKYQSNESDNGVADMWEDNISLGNQYHLQFNNRTLMEDIGIAEKVNLIGVDHQGIFSIHNKDNNSGNGIMKETRLEKLNKL